MPTSERRSQTAAAMKCFVLAFTLLAIAATVFAHPPPPPPEIEQYHKECETELGITRPPPPHLAEHGANDDPKVKCFHACMLKKVGHMVDGKIVLEKEIEVHTHRMPNDDSLKTKITECVTKANAASEECEVAHTMGTCLEDSEILPPPPKHD